MMKKVNNYQKSLIAIAVNTILLSSAWAASPPNLLANITWSAGSNGVADIEAAFNNGRRQEEIQLSLATNTLGTLKLPTQTIWNGMSDDAKGLYLLNAERTARAGMQAGVIGLPLAGIESNIDSISQAYAQLLHDTDAKGHYQPSGNSGLDSPTKRIEQNAVIGSLHASAIQYNSGTNPTHTNGSMHYYGDTYNSLGACHEFINRSENLAYFASSTTIPLPVERAIYEWIYNDAGSAWGHREAALLQDQALSSPNANYGFKNNNGALAHEGFLGFHHISSTAYQPFGAGYTYGSVVVMNIFDPVSDTIAAARGCAYNVTLRTEDLPTPTTNHPPVAVNDTASTAYQTAVTISAVTNDTDADSDPLTIASFTQPGHGTVSASGNVFTYTPATGFSGTDTFNYTVSDGKGGTATGTVTITVAAAINHPPVAVNDTANTAYQTAVTISAVTNDTDADSDLLTVASFTQPGHGTVSASGNVFTYTPATGFSGTDTFTYTVSDGKGGTATGTVTITVAAAVNHPPVAVNDTANTAYQTAVIISAVTNDTDADSDPLTVASFTQPGHGTVSASGNVFTYTPATGFSGTDTFNYTVSDGKGGTATGTVTITVAAAVNHPPVAVNDTASTAYQTAVTISAVTNDTDADSDLLTVASFTQPGHGTVSASGNVFTYTPATGFSGTDTFNYTVSDGKGGTASATVTITVAASTNHPPVAVNDTANTAYQTAVTISAVTNDTDADSDPLTVASFTQPGHGTVSTSGNVFTYTPATGFSGTDTFTYTVSDGRGGIATGTVTITVAASTNHPPVAVNDTASTAYQTAVTISAVTNDTDADSDPLTVASFTQPSHGTVSASGNVFTYTPATGFSGTDTFTYTVSDGKGGTATGTVTITVAAAVNHPPVAVNDTASTAYQTAVTISAVTNDTDADSDPLTVASFTQPGHGTVSASGSVFTYTPATGFSGTDTFNYTVSDGKGGTASATVTILVGAAPNHAPVAVDDAFSTAYQTALTISSVLANDTDADHDTLSVSANTPAAHGTLTRVANNFTYVPNQGYSGLDTFTYTVNDGKGGSATASVTITVLPEASMPEPSSGGVIPGADSVTTPYQTPITLDNLLANDTDIDGDNNKLRILAYTPASHGSVVRTGNILTYTPKDGFSGQDSFNYIVLGASGSLATATVTVKVAEPNNSPDPKVNAPPSFKLTDDPLYHAKANAGMITVPNWVVYADDGEGGRQYPYGKGNTTTDKILFKVISNSNAKLFDHQPEIGYPSHALTFKPNLVTQEDSADICVVAVDKAGAGLSSNQQCFSLNIAPVIDKTPVISLNPQVTLTTLLNNSGPQALTVIAQIKDSTGNPISNPLTINLISNTNPQLFSVQPQINSITQTLDFTPNADAQGSADICLVATDTVLEQSSTPACITINVTGTSTPSTPSVGTETTGITDSNGSTGNTSNVSTSDPASTATSSGGGGALGLPALGLLIGASVWRRLKRLNKR